MLAGIQSGTCTASFRRSAMRARYLLNMLNDPGCFTAMAALNQASSLGLSARVPFTVPTQARQTCADSNQQHSAVWRETYQISVRNHGSLR